MEILQVFGHLSLIPCQVSWESRHGGGGEEQEEEAGAALCHLTAGRSHSLVWAWRRV